MILESTAQTIKKHDGKNAQKVRVYLGVKQASLAADLGISQEAVSKIEQQEKLRMIY